MVITGKPQHLRAPGVVHRLGAQHLDQLLEVHVALRVLVEAEPLGGPDDVAAVERRDPEARRAGA